jgi:hypothetical protein
MRWLAHPFFMCRKEARSLYFGFQGLFCGEGRDKMAISLIALRGWGKIGGGYT